MITGNVVLAVTGSIAAFKSAQLASELVQAGLAVRVILTRGGSQFVTAMTFEAITGHTVARSMWDKGVGDFRMEHLDLASWGEVLVVAPASADAIARLAQGRSYDLLGATALAFRGSLLFAPAMEANMYTHPATAANIELLSQRGATLLGPETGRLASGASGVGRMSEPSVIAQAVYHALTESSELSGRKVLVTAGPTYEPIDPVRFIGNRSSGKMGYAVAAEAARRGGDVLLVSGPTAVAAPVGVQCVQIETADQMREAVLSQAAQQDVVVMCAAVADYAPAEPSRTKLKRGEIRHIELTPTEDIAAAAARAAPHALHVGFALESGDLIPAAREKLRRKGQTLVVANAITTEHNPFGSNTNKVVFVTEKGERALSESTKPDVARALWDEIMRLESEQ